VVLLARRSGSIALYQCGQHRRTRLTQFGQSDASQRRFRASAGRPPPPWRCTAAAPAFRPPGRPAEPGYARPAL